MNNRSEEDAIYTVSGGSQFPFVPYWAHFIAYWARQTVFVTFARFLLKRATNTEIQGKDNTPRVMMFKATLLWTPDIEDFSRLSLALKSGIVRSRSAACNSPLHRLLDGRNADSIRREPIVISV